VKQQGSADTGSDAEVILVDDGKKLHGKKATRPGIAAQTLDGLPFSQHLSDSSALAGIRRPMPRAFHSAGCGMPQRFQVACAWGGSALPGITCPAQGLQPAFAADKEFRVGWPQLAAAAAFLFRPQFCIQGHCITRPVRFPASGVGRVLDSPDQFQFYGPNVSKMFRPAKPSRLHSENAWGTGLLPARGNKLASR
jgi:hypothetical protein